MHKRDIITGVAIMQDKRIIICLESINIFYREKLCNIPIKSRCCLGIQDYMDIKKAFKC